MKNKYILSEKQRSELSELLSKFAKQSEIGKEWSVDPDKIISGLKSIAEGCYDYIDHGIYFLDLKKVDSSYPVIIPDCKAFEFRQDVKNFFAGRESVAKMFLAHACPKRFTANTKPTTVEVYYYANTGPTIRQAFESLNRSFDGLCLTQHQIIKFCQKNLKWMQVKSVYTKFVFLTRFRNSYNFVIFKNEQYDGLSERSIDYANVINYQKSGGDPPTVLNNSLIFVIVPAPFKNSSFFL